MDSSREIVKKLRENRLLTERADYSNMDHAELVKLAQDGDQLAFETLLSEYDPAIEKAASKFIFDSGDSDDAKQIASIGFWEAVQGWEGNGSFGSYANMIMHRKLTDQLRKDSAGKELINSQSASLDAPAATDDEGGEMTLGASIPSKSLSPEEEYLGRDGARKIMEFIQNELSETERDVIRRYIKGYKVSEIAEETGMKYKSAENALKRVKDKLAEYMRSVRESRHLREGSLFSDEEKEILTSIFNKIEEQKALEESAATINYEDMTEEQLDAQLGDIEAEVEELSGLTTEEDWDKFSELIDKCEEVLDKIFAMEDYLTDDQYQKSEELKKDLMRLQRAEFSGENDFDPYKDAGMKRSDF